MDGYFLMPETAEGCLNAAIEAEAEGNENKAEFLLGMAEIMECPEDFQDLED